MSLNKKDQDLIAAATKAIEVALPRRLAGGRRRVAHARRPHRHRRQSRRLCRARRGLRRSRRHWPRAHRKRRPRHRGHRRRAPSQARGAVAASAVVSPCGTCRELIHDYDAKAKRDRSGRQDAEDRDDREAAAEQIPAGYDMSTNPRLVAADKRDDDVDANSAPAAAGRFRRPGTGARQSRRLHRGRARAQGSARPCAVLRAAGPGQDHAGADRGARTGRQFPRHLRAGDRQGGRSRRDAHQSRAARCSVHRRNPPAQSGGRGNPLSGDGGFRARSRHRRRAGGAFGEDRSCAVHAGRRHHARRPASPIPCATASAFRCG